MGLSRELIIEVEPYGLDQETIRKIKSICSNHPSIQSYLKGTRHLLLSLELLDSEDIPGKLFMDSQKKSQLTPVIGQISGTLVQEVLLEKFG